MNAKTSKLLNRIAALTNQRRKDVKRGWNRMPRKQRGEFRKKIRAEAERAAKGSVIV